MKRLPLLALLLLCLALPTPAAAAVTTKHYSLDPPDDWVMIKGPSRERDATFLHLGTRDHSCSASITTYESRSPSDVQDLAKDTARSLGAGPPAKAKGQYQGKFTQKGVKGYFVVREDPKAKLLLRLIVSGETRKADFLFRMRSPHKALIPAKP
ncbi:MAG: hypothetical protein LBR22_07795 [Desulfovibrio sp.]|nr:hypothetical protein [Desulfovibrio sp.]